MEKYTKCLIHSLCIYPAKLVLQVDICLIFAVSGNQGLPGGTSGKEPCYNTGDVKDVGSIPGLGIYPGGGHGNLLQYSCQACYVVLCYVL